MPIIELHGLSGVDALTTKTKIFDSAKQHTPELLPHILVDIYPDTCTDYKGDKQSFVRVFTVSYEEQVLKILQKAGINLHFEFIAEKRFIPKQK